MIPKEPEWMMWVKIFTVICLGAIFIYHFATEDRIKSEKQERKSIVYICRKCSIEIKNYERLIQDIDCPFCGENINENFLLIER